MSINLPGFHNYVIDSHQVFRAALDAMAHPGRCYEIDCSLLPPARLHLATAAVLLTLADADTALWVDPAAQSAMEWITFHCGCSYAPLEQADIAIALEWPDFLKLKAGNDEEPELGATLVLQVDSLQGGFPLQLTGPGLSAPSFISPQLPKDFASFWKMNHARFPCGVDVILCSGRSLAALPRSLEMEAS